MTLEAAQLATELLQGLVGDSFVQLCAGVGDAQLNFARDGGLSLEAPVQVGQSGPVVPYSLAGIALLLPLLDGEVTAAAVDDDGGLAVTIGGTTLRCPRTPEFEAWNYHGPGGVLVVSAAGGLAVWSAQ